MCDLSIDCSNGEDENLSECDLSSKNRILELIITLLKQFMFLEIHPQRKCDTEDTFHCTYSRKCIPKDCEFILHLMFCFIG